MSKRSLRSTLSKLGLAAAGLVLAHQAGAQVMLTAQSDLHAIAAVDSRLETDAATAPLDEGRDALRIDADLGFDEFVARAGGTWVAQVDRRTGYIAYVEGSGIPWFPGAGNDLAAEELTDGGSPDLASYDHKARQVAREVARMLGFDPDSLQLNLGRSGAPAPHVWFVDFDVLLDGRPVEGSRVLFVVNNGNLISVGTENLPVLGTRAPERRFSVEEALKRLADHIGGTRLDDEWVDAGSYHLLPTTLSDVRYDEGFAAASGRGVAGVWQFVFRRPGQIGTFRGRVDATTGDLLEFRDVNEYGSITGGVYQSDRPSPERVLPMPFAEYATSSYANSAGIFSGTSGTTALNGQYVRISDSCGSISKSADGSGNIALGSSSGTDCTTPGSGGSGNTHSARTQFYNLNRIKEVGRGWLPSNSWLTAKLTANVNLNQTCNAYWNGSTVNFFRSGGGCANTGELPGVSLHEWGHGLDSNDGSGSSADNGTGETYGDFTAALATHASCTGNGFFSSGSNCSGYGDACTSCSGIRDIDWAKHASNTPHTVDNFTRVHCPTSSNYRGPCGREGHCESYVSSEALWDIANRDLPNPGSGAAWTTVDRLWYLSRSSATKAFNCTASGTWTANGCFTGSYFRSMRSVDDDDGNLSNGTPHGGALAAAFNRHGIACTSDAGWNVTHAGVTPPAVPSLTATGGSNSVSLSWSGSSGVYDVYRNETSCNAGFTRIANDVSGTSLNDNAVANGFTYYYQVVAQPSGNEAAASAPSTCRSVTPGGGSCTPPAAPTGVSASAPSQTAINVSWNASSGATSYKVYRATTSGGPYSQVGTSTSTSFSDTGLTCNTTYYYVVTASNGSCDSGNSSQASATTQACTGGTTATFDPTLQAPKCGAVVNSCDTGASLVLGRAGLGPEPNQPNTINDSCSDGTSGSFHSDESNDRVKVYTLDGTDFAPGKQVRVEATVWAWSGFSSDHLDLYYAADATSPSWTLIGTVNPTAAGAQVLSATYTLPTGGSLQAVRAAFRYNGSASSCTSGSYNDRDDLVFAVDGGGGDTTPPTTSITAPANGATVSGTVNVTASASDNVGVTSVQFFVDGALAGTDTSSPYSYSWDTTAVSNGSHSLFSRAFDAAGNMGTSTTVTVTVSNTVPDTTPPSTSITSPANGATVSGTVTVTASASDNVGVTSVQFFVDGALASTDTSSPYSYSWNTTAVSDGSHSLFSRAFDAAGNSGTSSTVSVTVDNSTGGNELQNGVPVTGISGASGSQQFWTLDVPSGASNLVFEISGGSGDADLYVRFGADPTLTTYDCRPWLNGNNETCTFASPSTGTYHVMLNGYAAYSGVTLVGSFDEPGGGCTTTSLYSNSFDSASGLSDWTRGTFVSGGSTTSWRGVQTCTAASGSRIFRYGGTGCTSNYSSNNFNYAEPKGATGISVPVGSTDTVLEFQHRRRFESGYDGGTLALSLDGSNYYWVDALALSGAAYNGTISASCPPAGAAGRAVFTGASTSFSTTSVDLDVVCNAITGGSGGCAGQTVHVAFVSISDCSVTDDGWFLDDVQVTACTP